MREGWEVQENFLEDSQTGAGATFDLMDHVEPEPNTGLVKNSQ